MYCELCYKTKKYGVKIDDISTCDTCACKLLDVDELDMRDFSNATRL